MSYIIKMRNSRKNHLLVRLADLRTICGKLVKTGEIMDEWSRNKELNLCQKCYAFIGEQMVGEWFGTDFFIVDARESKEIR